MSEHSTSVASTTEGLPVAPSLGPTLERTKVPRHVIRVDQRTVRLSATAMVIGIVAGLVAQGLVELIALITNIAFYGRFSIAPVSAANNHLGALVLLVPVAGGVIVGLMARYGSQAIRGHGIPEAMERVLLHQSRIPPRLTFLKPLSAAVSIGTGGPFGAEGPIIATGGALGSLVGQLLRTTAAERKTLLASGAAAGMAATFGSPVAAVLLAIELLLFELSPRSLVPVAFASATAAGVRMALVGSAPVFPMPLLQAPSSSALGFYMVLGALLGVFSVGITRAVYIVEDAFEKLPIHWMWWPALGALAVGVVGYFAPRTLGVGYDNIEDIIAGRLVGTTLALLCAMKFLSWVVALGSGTSGGTLAPLFTVGGGLGAVFGELVMHVLPGLGVDARLAGLVGMAAVFAGASRAPLTSLVFAFETTRQPVGLLPLLGGCMAAYLVSILLMRNSIMTEKIVRRGVAVPIEYGSDILQQLSVRDCASFDVVALAAGDRVGAVRDWFASGVEGSEHQGFPVVNEEDELIGVITRRDLNHTQEDKQLKDIVKRTSIVVYPDTSLKESVERMASEQIGRLPVVSPEEPLKVVGMLTRSDLLTAYRRQVEENYRAERSISLRVVRLPWYRKRKEEKVRALLASPQAGFGL